MKLTPWYPGHIKPVRKGVYEVAYWGKQNPSYAKWNGSAWMASHSPICKEAYTCAKEQVLTNIRQDLPWCGIAKD